MEVVVRLEGREKSVLHARIFIVGTGRIAPPRGISLRFEAMPGQNLPREPLANPDQEEEAMASHAIFR